MCVGEATYKWRNAANSARFDAHNLIDQYR